MNSSARAVTARVRSSSVFQIGARSGFVVSGILHALIGGIAIGLPAISTSASQSGALRAVAALPGGTILLWAMAIGLAALGLWQLTQMLLVVESEPGKRWAQRAKEGGKGVAYLAVAVVAARLAGSGSSSGQTTQTVTARLLGTPGGVVLLAVIAAVIVGIGVFFVVKGIRRRFLDDITLPPKPADRGVTVLGLTGYIAKGIAITVVGVLMGIATFTADPERATGLDGALATLAGLPFGHIILIAVGVGLIAYGLYYVVRARYAKL